MQRIRSGMFVFVSTVTILTLLLFGNVFLTHAQPTSIPRVWTITADTNPTETSQRTFTVKFSEAVTGVDPTDFSTAGDDQFARITGVNTIDDTSDTYRVVVAINGPSTQLALNLFDNDSILNTAGIPLGGEGINNGNAVSDVININTPSQMQPQFDAIQPQVDVPASTDHQVGYYTSIALTSTDIPIISYWDYTNRDLKLAVCDDIICQSPFITTIESTGIVGLGTSIALTSTDIPIISYVDYTNSQLKLAICNDKLCTNPTIAIIDNSSMYISELSISLELTSTDIPVVSYVDGIDNDLELVVCTDAACSDHTNTILDNGDTTKIGQHASLALTSANAPVVSYYDDISTDLKLAICTDATCASHTITTVESTPNRVGKYSSVALTSTDMPVISYFDQTNNDLRLAICADVSCTSVDYTNIDSTDDVVGLYTSIALTEADAPFISYYDFTNTSLKLAICNNASCTTKTVSPLDNSGFVGEYTSIALTSTEVAVVSYYDASNKNLKLSLSPSTIDQGQPNSFAKSAPTNNSIVTTASTTLTWDSSMYASSYEYCYATSIATCTTWISTDTATSATISDLVHNTTYYWQVRATNSSGTQFADDEAYHSFTVVLPPTSFAKSTPTNAQSITTSSTTLTWSSSTYATSYEYCIATSIATCTTWISTGTATSATLTGLAHGTTYYWQVRARNSGGTTTADSDAHYRFTVSLPPASFAKSAPANNATNQKTSVTLSWAASTRATSYEYCYAVSTAACTNWKSTGTARTATITGLTKNKAYYWQVRAKNAGGTTLSNTTYWKFTTAP